MGENLGQPRGKFEQTITPNKMHSLLESNRIKNLMQRKVEVQRCETFTKREKNDRTEFKMISFYCSRSLAFSEVIDEVECS